MSKRVLRKPIQQEPTKARKKPKTTNRKLLEDQLSMLLSMPEAVMKLKGWTEEQFDEEVERLNTALGLSKAGAMKRRKGSTYERRIAKIFLAAWGLKLSRTPMSGGFKKDTSSEDFRGDLNTIDKLIRFLLHTECKDHATWKLKEWYEQAASDCPPGKIPIVIMHQAQEVQGGKRTRQADDFVMIRLSDFLDIVDTAKVIQRLEE